MSYELLTQSFTEENSQVIMYGFSCKSAESVESFVFESLSADKDIVSKFVRLCEDGEVDEISIGYVVEDFIACL